MFRNLAGLLTAPGTPTDPTALFGFHPVQLHRYLEEAWTLAGRAGTTTTPVFLGENQRIVPVLRRPAPILVKEPSVLGPGLPPPGPLPWEHLIYAYLLENTGMLRIFRRVVELYAVGEALEVPTDVTRQWLRTSEELMFRDPPQFTVGSVVSDLRPNLEATRRNAYWRLLGMDLDHGGPDGRPVPYPRVAAANVDFVAHFEAFLREVWQNYINRVNTSGENYSDPDAVANRADMLAKGLRVRRLQGNLAREEFFFTAVLSWFHVTLETDNAVILDLKATAADAPERLRKIGDRVGIPPHPRTRDLIMMAEAASTILRFVELEQFSDQANAATLYSGTGAISVDVLTIINHWSLATGRNLKVRTADTAGPGPRPQPAAAPPRRAVPAAEFRPSPAAPSGNGRVPASVDGRRN